MIEETALVTDIDGDLITVESEVKSACSGCQQVDNCGSGQVAKAFPQKKLSLTLTSSLPITVGDSVVLGLNESMLLKTAWQVYFWPLFGLILGGWFGQSLLNVQYINSEFFAILIALLSGYLGFIFARKYQSTPKNCQELAPKILRIERKTISVTEISN